MWEAAGPCGGVRLGGVGPRRPCASRGRRHWRAAGRLPSATPVGHAREPPPHAPVLQAAAGCDIVMLDNYTPAALVEDARALKHAYPHVLVEASGVRNGAPCGGHAERR